MVSFPETRQNHRCLAMCTSSTQPAGTLTSMRLGDYALIEHDLALTGLFGAVIRAGEDEHCVVFL
jgi:hypothetical protein